MSKPIKPLSPALGRVYSGLVKSAALARLLTVANAEDSAKLAAEKIELDQRIFSDVKIAAGAGGFMTSMLEAGKNQLPNLGKGAVMAAGAAIPTVLAGNYLVDRSTEKARDRALEAGVGLAGIGAGMYGLHRLMGSNKQASDAVSEAEAVDNACQKLAAVGYLDTMMTSVIAGLDGDAKKTAEEVLALNRDFGLSVLANLIGV